MSPFFTADEPIYLRFFLSPLTPLYFCCHRTTFSIPPFCRRTFGPHFLHPAIVLFLSCSSLYWVGRGKGLSRRGGAIKAPHSLKKFLSCRHAMGHLSGNVGYDTGGNEKQKLLVLKRSMMRARSNSPHVFPRNYIL